MVLTKQELIQILQNEVRILVHLCGKVKPEMLDYRPTPKQRSTIELLRYLTVMGPVLVPSITELRRHLHVSIPPRRSHISQRSAPRNAPQLMTPASSATSPPRRLARKRYHMM